MTGSTPEASPGSAGEPVNGDSGVLSRIAGQADRLSHWIEPAIVFAATLVLCLAAAAKDTTIHPDTIGHLLRMKDCLEGAGCHVSLGQRSIIGIRHGAIYLHFLVLVHWLGGGAMAAKVLFCLLSTVGVTLLYLLGRRLGGPVFGAIGAIVYAPAVAFEHMLLWNPAMTPVLAVLCVLLLHRVCRSGRPLHLFLLALMVSVGIQVHLAFGALLVPLGLAVFTQPREYRGHAAAVVPAIVAGGILIGSPGMFDVWLEGVPWPRLLLGAPFFIAAVVLAYLFLSKRTGPFFAILLISYLPPFALIRIVGAETRYTHTLLPGLVLLGVLGAAYAWKRIPKPRTLGPAKLAYRTIGLALLGYFLVPFAIEKANERPELTHWEANHAPTMEETQAVAEHLSDRGIGFEEAFRLVRGGAFQWHLLTGLAYYLDAKLDAATRSQVDEDISFHRAPSDVPLPKSAGWFFLDGAPGVTVGLRSYRPWLRWDEFDACIVEGESECVPTRVSLEWFALTDSEQLSDRVSPHLPSMPSSSNESFTLLIRLPVRIPAGGGERILEIPAVAGFKGCRGRVEDATGVLFEGTLPSKRVTLQASSVTQEGSLLLAWTFGGLRCPHHGYRRLPPPVLELRDHDELDYISRSLDELQPETGAPATRRFLLAEIGPPLPQPEGESWRKSQADPTVPFFVVFVVALATIALILGSAVMSLSFISSRKNWDESDEPGSSSKDEAPSRVQREPEDS